MKSLWQSYLCSDFLDESKAKASWRWPKRKSIILDVAKGLAYLQYGVQPIILHTDIKATNFAKGYQTCNQYLGI
ncbi:hypothetical protein VIGAN_02142600 [Vigna angularis var. angularis]|uniref:Protein kinase domain-containing protein n=1 Tax=Vigna angularis var. angularis TaxID=157739 RepID=A0A0S3RDD5_PHAAN|nr:hypothetical protein VIGAN_02142600 [Vigna angularis var. angularis]